MANKIDQIVSVLSEGVTEESINKVVRLVDQIVEERVEEANKLMEARVAAFVRNKVESLKDVAREEVLAESGTARELELFRAIKTLVASEIAGEDIENMAATYEKEIEGLQESVQSLNTKLDEQLQRNTLLEEQNEVLNESITDAEHAKNLLEAKLGSEFHGSDAAEVVTNDPDRPSVSEAALHNRFLTEDVIGLSRINRGII